MDQRTEPLQQDIASIRETMTEKMGQLETQLRTAVEEPGETLKRAVDLPYYVDEHPWVMVGTAVLLGYAVGSLTDSSESEQPRYAPQRDTTDMNLADWHQTISAESKSSSQPSTNFFDDLKEQFSDEIALAKTAAINSAVSLLRGVIRDNLPSLANELDRARRSPAVTNSRTTPSSVLPDPGLQRYRGENF